MKAVRIAALIGLVFTVWSHAWADGLDTRPTLEPNLGPSVPAPSLISQAPPEQPPAEAPPIEEPKLNYRMAIDGVEGKLEDRLKGISLLNEKEGQPPPGRAALLRRVETDLERFAALLKARGYYAYRLGHRVEFDKDPIRVTFDVEPNAQYKLAAFDIAYQKPDAPGLVTDPAMVGVTVGGAAFSKPVQDAPPALLRLLGERGYPLAKVESRKAVVDHGQQEMRVTLNVTEGPRVVFGETKVTGLEYTEPDYVVRVAALHYGEHFNVARIDEARRRLFRTGLFDGIEIKWADTPSADDVLDVLIEARERKRRTISLGLNYSTSDGAGADVSWEHRNIFGEDEDLRLTLRAAELEQSFKAELSAPNFRRLEQTVGVLGDLSRLTTEAFEERRAGVVATVARPLNERWRAGLGGELAYLQTRENNLKEENILLGFPLFASYDGADSKLNPTEGYKLDFTLTPAAFTLEETNLLTTLTAGGSAYQKLTDDDRVVAAARLKGGMILGPARDIIPASRRLYAGGGGSIRGYEFQTVGPLDANGDPEGGRSLLEGSVELRLKVTDDIGVVPFLDGGGAFEDPVPDFADLNFAAGIGARYFTPVGPLRLDVAFPLNGRERDNFFEFYVSLGQAF